MKKRIYTVTAGHDHKRRGVAVDGYQEEVLMAELRNTIAVKLRARGHTVRTDGEGLANLPLPHALTLIPGAHTAIELHTNAAANPAALGVEVYSLPKHKAKAQALAQSIATVLQTRVRGDGGWVDQSKSQHGSLGWVRAGGLLIEVFFLTNPAERAAYLARVWLVASAIVDTLDADNA